VYLLKETFSLSLSHPSRINNLKKTQYISIYLLVCNLIKNAVDNLVYTLKLNKELVRIWKCSWYKSKYYTGICLEGLRKPRKTSVSIVDDPTKIATRHLPNVIQNYYHMNQLVRSQTYSVRMIGLRGLKMDEICLTRNK
jgi:hypothetical protein